MSRRTAPGKRGTGGTSFLTDEHGCQESGFAMIVLS